MRFVAALALVWTLTGEPAGFTVPSLAFPRELGNATRSSADPICSPDRVPLAIRYRPLTAADGTDRPAHRYRPLDRKAVLYERTEVVARVPDPCSARYTVRRYEVGIGGKPLCTVDAPDGSCEIGFGPDLRSWTLDIEVLLLDREKDATMTRRQTVTTLDAGLPTPRSRVADAGGRVSLVERTGTRSVPYDEIWRTVLVLNRTGEPRQGLSVSDFRLGVGGIRGEELIDAVPISRLPGDRLLFVLFDASSFVRESKRGPQWTVDYPAFVHTVIRSLERVAREGRRLLVVRYAGSADASPVVELDRQGLAAIGPWLMRPPLPSWKSGRADRTAALQLAYDLFLHDFPGPMTGVIVSGGRDDPSARRAIRAAERLQELNPLWPPERLAALLAELDAGRIDLFPHAEQRGFFLSWLYRSAGKELTGRKFLEASQYFRRFGGEVYRLSDIHDPEERAGHTARGGSRHMDDVLDQLLDELEQAYLVKLRIPNPRQRRVDRDIRLDVDGSVVRTQTFYRPSRSLREKIENYLSSRSKERRFRAAYAARNYPLDETIYRKLHSWLPDEPASQVRPVLEESMLLMEIKRSQAPDASVRRRAIETLFRFDPSELDDTNRPLLATLREIAVRRMTDEPERYGGPQRVEQILDAARAAQSSP